MFARLKGLLGNLLVYGAGDVATSVVSFLLLPIYTRYLTPSDYGVIALLLIIEAISKIVFRWGVDSAFMRFYYDCPDLPGRRRLTSTIFFFLLACNGTLLALGLALAPALGGWLFEGGDRAPILRLVFVNTFLVGFYFIPLHLLRIEERSRQFTVIVFARAAATLALRLGLVVGAGLGVVGVVLADVAVSMVMSIVLLRRVVPLLGWTFSRDLLGDALRFGLPRVPHGLAHQVIAISDRYLLSAFMSLRDVGVYSIGATFGLALKLFLSAFEYAWAPFYFGVMKQPDAPRIYAVVTTYVVAILVFLAAGLSAMAADLIALMTTAEFAGAAAVIPWITVGVVCQGFYQLTSIGLSITKQTQYYPVATGIAAAASVGANLLLIPAYGVMGAAWAHAVSYATLALVAMQLSQRQYPVPYEWSRLARVILAGLGSYLVATTIPAPGSAFWGGLARGAVVVALFPAILGTSGFFRPTELKRLGQLRSRVRPTASAAAIEPDPTEMAGEIIASAPVTPPIDDGRK